MDTTYSTARHLAVGALAMSLSLSLGLIPAQARAVERSAIPGRGITARPAPRGQALPAGLDLMLRRAPARTTIQSMSSRLEATSIVAGTAWSQQAELTPADHASNDYFGTSVAASGNTVLVGATQLNSARHGAAYVYVRSGTTWTLQATLIPAGEDTFQVGSAVALEGNTAVIGAAGTHTGAGAVFVFVRNGTTWTQQATLTAADSSPEALFGNALSLSGNTLLIGARQAGLFFGAAYVFVRSGSTRLDRRFPQESGGQSPEQSWSQQAEFADPLPRGSEDFFGSAVALSGNTALVSAPHKNGSTGVVYAFVRNGTSWTQQATLSNPPPQSGNNFFGGTMVLSGTTALIGANDAEQTGGALQPTTYVFARSGSTWSQQQEIASPDGIGYPGAISGNTALIAGGTSGGLSAVYVYGRSGVTWLDRRFPQESGGQSPEQSWTQQAVLTATDETTSDAFGSSMALSGSTAVVGAPDKNNFMGAAYVFVRS